jgi:hypothetical protein
MKYTIAMCSLNFQENQPRRRKSTRRSRRITDVNRITHLEENSILNIDNVAPENVTSNKNNSQIVQNEQSTENSNTEIKKPIYRRHSLLKRNDQTQTQADTQSRSENQVIQQIENEEQQNNTNNSVQQQLKKNRKTTTENDEQTNETRDVAADVNNIHSETMQTLNQQKNTHDVQIEQTLHDNQTNQLESAENVPNQLESRQLSGPVLTNQSTVTQRRRLGGVPPAHLETANSRRRRRRRRKKTKTELVNEQNETMIVQTEHEQIQSDVQTTTAPIHNVHIQQEQQLIFTTVQNEHEQIQSDVHVQETLSQTNVQNTQDTISYDVQIEQEQIKNSVQNEHTNKTNEMQIEHQQITSEVIVENQQVVSAQMQVEQDTITDEFPSQFNFIDDQSVIVQTEHNSIINTNRTGIDVWELASDQKQSPLFRFMFRYTLEQQFNEKNLPQRYSNEAIIEILKSIGTKKYAFQLEKGEQTNRLHYQGYINLSNKVRQKQLARSMNYLLPGIEIRAINDEKCAIAYCTKIETRVSGPWSFP